MTERWTLTVEQTARVLGLGRGLTYQLVREGRIPSIRLGRRLLVPRRQLEAMLLEPGAGLSPPPRDGASGSISSAR